MEQNRRADDSRVKRVEHKLGELERKLDSNTEATREVLDLIRSFKLLGRLATWAAGIAGGAIAVWHFIVNGR